MKAPLGTRMLRALNRIVLGRRLANDESAGRTIGAIAGVPAMGLDALASSAYSPEAALIILRAAGAAGVAMLVPITAGILALLLILFLSYRQIIQAYPSNGGGYVVAKQNLGTTFGVTAAAALIIDYVLNVAVAISTGVAALISAVPALHGHTLALCLLLLMALALVNLRGTPETVRLFAIPTYLFVLCFAVLILAGISGVATAPVGAQNQMVTPPIESLNVWLVLRAFASGCTAMTGIEAVSNNVSVFREPRVKHAQRTLLLVVSILALLLLGIVVLVRRFNLQAMDEAQPGYQMVLSQLAMTVAGRGTFYYVSMFSLLCVLSLSASTSFVALPRLCRTAAEDGFLPHSFAVAGRRLVFSAGIVFLIITSGALLIIFDGDTSRLIPLFAIGAFLTFTLSQAGMVAHWRGEQRKRDAARWQGGVQLAINAAGAIATGCALLVILIAKFASGAWITVVAIVLLIMLLRSIKRYYDALYHRLQNTHVGAIDISSPPIMLVPVESWNQLADKTLRFSSRLSPTVIAIHFLSATGPETEVQDKEFEKQWQTRVVRPLQDAGVVPPQLRLLPTPYRRMHVSLLKFIDELAHEFPRRVLAVVLPVLVKEHWWQVLLHSFRATRLRNALLRHAGSRMVVINVPWYLHEPTIAEALEVEEQNSEA